MEMPMSLHPQYKRLKLLLLYPVPPYRRVDVKYRFFGVFWSGWLAWVASPPVTTLQVVTEVDSFELLLTTPFVSCYAIVTLQTLFYLTRHTSSVLL